jgi:hypothetical protein
MPFPGTSGRVQGSTRSGASQPHSHTGRQSHGSTTSGVGGAGGSGGHGEGRRGDDRDPNDSGGGGGKGGDVEGGHYCHPCSRAFKNRQQLYRHNLKFHRHHAYASYGARAPELLFERKDGKYNCVRCPSTLQTKDSLVKHTQLCGGKKKITEEAEMKRKAEERRQLEAQEEAEVEREKMGLSGGRVRTASAANLSSSSTGKPLPQRQRIGEQPVVDYN